MAGKLSILLRDAILSSKILPRWDFVSRWSHDPTSCKDGQYPTPRSQRRPSRNGRELVLGPVGVVPRAFILYITIHYTHPILMYMLYTITQRDRMAKPARTEET